MRAPRPKSPSLWQRGKPMAEPKILVVGDTITDIIVMPEGPMVRLQPANAAMKPIRVPAKDVRIQGIVVGLMRKF